MPAPTIGIYGIYSKITEDAWKVDWVCKRYNLGTRSCYIFGRNAKNAVLIPLSFFYCKLVKRVCGERWRGQRLYRECGISSEWSVSIDQLVVSSLLGLFHCVSTVTIRVINIYYNVKAYAADAVIIIATHGNGKPTSLIACSLTASA